MFYWFVMQGLIDVILFVARNKRSLSEEGGHSQDDDRPRKRRYNDEGSSRQEIRLLVQSHVSSA